MNRTTPTIAFVRDGKKIEIDFLQAQPWTPTTTVLQYLRSLPDRKGTKEGCAEGDCGACTVVVGEPGPDGKMQYRACDSCLIFLPMLHGKELISVEDLGTHDALHPVQKAMVDCDGSQCGYCTPGFVMSMFALYKQPGEIDRAEVLDGLTGNLCRCTGYRPIIAATEQACQQRQPDRFSAQEAQTAAALAGIQSSGADLDLHTRDQRYLRPASLGMALALRKVHPDALIVCGGTDVGLKVTKQKQLLPLLLDLSGVPELSHIVPDGADGYFEIGATAPLQEVFIQVREVFPALYDMLAVFGSRQIRWRGTLGGNLANASPIGDTPPVLMALEAEVELLSVNGSRRMRVADFITGYRKTDLRPDELIARVFIPRTPAGTIVRSYKISKRKDLDISTVSGGFRLRLAPDGTVAEIALIYGGMAAMTLHAQAAEDFLLGHPWTRDRVEAAMPLIDAAFTPISDARSGKEGRRLMARNLLLKFWADTVSTLQPADQ
jgi:xanthine dehydrogenase small subunit